MTPTFQEEELEAVPCDLCGAERGQELFVRPDGMRVVECAACGLAWLSPRPKPEFIQLLYAEEYFKKSTSSSDLGYSDYLSESNRLDRIQDAQDKIRFFRSFWSPEATRCVEIGAATGEFSAALHESGALVKGYDTSEFVVGEAKRRYPHIEFHAGGIEAVPADGGFDAVFGFELIEHVTSPSAFLRAAHALLKQDGLLIISTPNLECGRSVGWERWLGFSTSFEHLYFLGPSALQRLAEKEGFVLERWFTGLGNGVEWGTPAPAEGRIRALARKTLDSMGLLEPLRTYRHRTRPDVLPPARYQPGGSQHNLLAVLRKSADARLHQVPAGKQG